MSAQAHELNARSLQVRQARAHIRAGLRGGTLTLADVFADHADTVATIPLVVLVMWRRGWGKARQRQIGAAAIRDQVNLFIRAGDASCRTRDWLLVLDTQSTGAYPFRGEGRWEAA